VSAYLYGGLALLVVGLGIATWGQSKRNEVLVAQNAGLRAELSTLSAANASQKQTIDELTTANVGLAAQAVTHAREYKAALQDLSSANVVRNALQKALMAKESTDRQSVACQALLGMDIKRVCPQIAEDMQSRAK
jgi:hypothetical protein